MKYEIDEMALAGILSTQLVQHHFIEGGGAAVANKLEGNQKIMRRSKFEHAKMEL